jgi:tetratricopeptide (TPR) repeat protein
MKPPSRGRTAAGVAVVLAALVSSCSEPKVPPPSKNATADEAAALASARNLGKLHFDRETEEGYAASVAAWREAVALSKGGRDEKLNLARALLETKEGAAEAATLLSEVAATWTDADRPAAVDYLRGLAAKRVDDHEASAAHFDRAAKRRPDHAHAALQKGRALFLLKRMEDALVAFDAALTIDPTFRAAAFHRYVVLERLGRDAAEVEAAHAVYDAIPEAGQPDPERCDFTKATRIPIDRRDAEPAQPTLVWRDSTAETTSVAALSGVVAFVLADSDDDGREEIFAATASGIVRARRGVAAAETLRSSGAFADVRSLAAGDVDNDGLFDLVVARDGAVGFVFGATTPSPVVVDAAVDGVPRTLDLFDYDHDGDLDAIVVVVRNGAASANVLRNNGDRTFARMSDVFLGAIAPGLVRADAHDVDQRNDLDFVFPTQEGAVAFLNRRAAGFAAAPLALAIVGAGVAVVRVEDLDADGAPDLLTAGAAGLVVAKNADSLGRPHAFVLRDATTLAIDGGVVDCVLEDADLDGDFDAIAATTRGFVVARNRRGGEFSLDAEVPTDAPVRRIATGVLDGDPSADVVLLLSDGRLRVFSSAATPSYAGWTVRPEGRQDNRGSVGAVVEQSAGALYQSAMIKGPSGLRLGLGRFAREGIDGLRLRYPQGVVQPVFRDELVFDAAGTCRFKQKEGLVASCPFLYVAGPSGMEFLTDVVGIAPLDEWLPPGATPILDPEERVRIDGAKVSTADGVARFSITEELRETTYLDRVELDALDHPADLDLFVDESTRQGAYDPFVVFAARTRELAPPTRVLLPNGADAAAEAAAIDGRYLHGYPDAPSQLRGWVPRYAIELETPIDARALLLTGRIAWYDSTVAYSAAQHGRSWGPLRLERVRDDGGVDVLVEDLGVPAGMDRTMVATWSTPVGKGGRLRLSGAHRFLWDRVAFAPSVERVEIDGDAESVELSDGRAILRRKAPLRAAVLREHGYSAIVGDRSRHEQRYAFDAAAPDDAFPRAVGRTTRFGPVDELLARHDDRFVVIVAGDRVDLDFEAPAAAAPDRRRTWFLLVTGFAKEGGFHNTTGSAIEPLPFRGMSRYPPPKGETPDDPAARDAYLRAFQTRPVR